MTRRGLRCDSAAGVQSDFSYACRSPRSHCPFRGTSASAMATATRLGVPASHGALLLLRPRARQAVVGATAAAPRPAGVALAPGVASFRAGARALSATLRRPGAAPAGGLRYQARRGGGEESPSAAERVVAALPYLLPLVDGLRYGAHSSRQRAAVEPSAGGSLLNALATRSQVLLRGIPSGPPPCPAAAAAAAGARPCVRVATRTELARLLQLYTTVPFASLIVFFGLYMGIVQNQSYSRFVRFNGQQAILLDILLILPSLVETLFPPPTSGFGLSVFISLCACPRADRRSVCCAFSPLRAQTTRCGSTSQSPSCTPSPPASSARRCCCRSWGMELTNRSCESKMVP